MKKNVLVKAAVLAMSAVLMMPATVLAAPSASAPVEMSVKQDGKTHKVFVFGTSLALVSTDGSIEISSIGPVGKVDVMIDGNLTKGVDSIDIPAGQLTKMVLDKDSVIVKNVSAETAKAVKKQISNAYAAGADSVDVASLTDVTAYKVNEDGTLSNAAGTTVSSKDLELTVSSVETASASFTAEINDIVKREAEAAAAEAEAKAKAAAATVEAPKADDSGNKNKEEVKPTPPEEEEEESTEDE